MPPTALLRRFPSPTGSAIVLWTLVLAGSLAWTLHNDTKDTLAAAYTEARANLNKDITFRRWVTDHGGIYVPITETQKSVPWLDHVPGRDVITSDGRQLTLLNPASVVRQLMDRYAQDYGIQGRITGLKYLNPDNAPDDWEKAQLEAFTRGEKSEIWATTDIDGKPHLRYLRAMMMEAGCKKCHGILGYEIGDVRGATGLNLPLAPYYAQISESRINFGLTHGIIWLLGLAGISLSSASARQRQQALQQAKAIIDSSDDAIISKNPAGIITSWNRGAQKIFGYTPEEAIGQSMRLLVPPDRPDEVTAILARILRGEIVERYETVRRCKAGRLIDISATISPVLGENGKIVGASVIARDISDRKRIARELEAQKENLEDLVDQRTIELSDALKASQLADQAKDAFLANISHELRTPLNAVIGMANLARSITTEPRQADYLDKITTSGKHLNRIVNDLLDLSKIAAGRVEFERIAFSVRGLVLRGNSVMAHRAAEKKLILIETIDDAVPDILVGDPGRIEQILLNLLSNAIKFTPTGQIEVRVKLHALLEKHVSLDIEVEDSGIGMSAADMTHLFQPFSQADASISRKYGGTGLGLTISRLLAKMMGGDISVSSREGGGTTFCVRIWLDLGDAQDLPASEPAETGQLPARYENTRVLVVEDQPLNREIVDALLTQVGITARMAENGQEALDILSESGADAFDLVLMDIQMPVMDGLTATRALRQRSEFAALPIIGMTAHTMEHERKISSDAGMNDHIGKPFDNASFFRTLARWIPATRQVMGDEPAARPPAASPPAAPRPAGTDLHALTGIDVTNALARFNGKEDRYRHWLADFLDTADQIPATIRSEIAAGQTARASKTVHALKGRVGMLGMTELHAEVSALESALRQGEPTDDLLARVEQLIAGLRGQLVQLFGALPAPLAGPAPAAPAARPAALEHVSWREAYSVGAAEMDAQHKRLVSMINQLADCWQASQAPEAAGSVESASAFHEILTAMFDYTQEHFRDEEAYLRKIGYPHTDAHETEHAAFIEKVAAISIAASEGMPDMVGVHHYLKSWLLGHILKSDMDYRHFIEQTKL